VQTNCTHPGTYTDVYKMFSLAKLARPRSVALRERITAYLQYRAACQPAQLGAVGPRTSTGGTSRSVRAVRELRLTMDGRGVCFDSIVAVDLDKFRRGYSLEQDSVYGALVHDWIYGGDANAGRNSNGASRDTTAATMAKPRVRKIVIAFSLTV
jgi:hypothetical protein